MDRDESEAARDALLEDNDDDLEFHITFPSPCASSASAAAAAAGGGTDPKEEDQRRQQHPEDEEGAVGGGGANCDGSDTPTPTPLSREFVFVSRDDPEPVVFLLGWAGCSDKHLARYSKLYEDCGCITIRYTAPAEYIFFDVEKIRPLSRKLLDLIDEMSLEANPVLFHVFSNNGATVYQYMSESLRLPEYTDLLPKVRGGVFDSAPGRRTNTAFLKAAAAAAAAAAGDGKDGGEGGLTSSSSCSSKSPFCYDFLKENDELRVPNLFLYSMADDIITAADVEEAADARAKRGHDVTKVCYDDSAHCQHYKRHRDSYAAAVTTFLNKCLKEKD